MPGVKDHLVGPGDLAGLGAGKVSEVSTIPMLDLVDELTPLPWELRLAPACLRAMLAESRRSYPLESCGDLFGKVDREAHWVHLATPAGPCAARESYTVERDHDYQFRWEDRVFKRDLVIRGLWHSHPIQNVPRPSARDLPGWAAFDAKRFDGCGHLQVIVGEQATRCWLVRTCQGKAWLVREWPHGMDRRTGIPR